MNRQLLHVNREKDDFLGIAAHDLKNPLSGILGISQIIAEDIDLLSKEDIREYAQLIVGRTNTMFRLITDLLNINALESGSLPLRPESFPVDDVLRDVIRSNTVAATSKHITLVYSPVPSSLAFADRHAVIRCSTICSPMPSNTLPREKLSLSLCRKSKALLNVLSGMKARDSAKRIIAKCSVVLPGFLPYQRVAKLPMVWGCTSCGNSPKVCTVAYGARAGRAKERRFLLLFLRRRRTMWGMCHLDFKEKICT